MITFPSTISTYGSQYHLLSNWRQAKGLPALPPIVLRSAYSRDPSVQKYDFTNPGYDDHVPRGYLELEHAAPDPNLVGVANLEEWVNICYITTDCKAVRGVGKAALCMAIDSICNAGARVWAGEFTQLGRRAFQQMAEAGVVEVVQPPELARERLYRGLVVAKM